LSPEEKKLLAENCMSYGASINDKEIFLIDMSAQ
jgi:hypothetical protein